MRLTEREAEVSAKWNAGATTTEIAAETGLSLDRVRKLIGSARGKGYEVRRIFAYRPRYTRHKESLGALIRRVRAEVG